jgi:hypothetical protein
MTKPAIIDGVAIIIGYMVIGVVTISVPSVLLYETVKWYNKPSAKCSKDNRCK